MQSICIDISYIHMKIAYRLCVQLMIIYIINYYSIKINIKEIQLKSK